MNFFVQVEKLLIEQNRLREQKKLQEESLALREREIQILQRTLPQPNLKVRETQTNSHLLCTDSWKEIMEDSSHNWFQTLNDPVQIFEFLCSC